MRRRIVFMVSAVFLLAVFLSACSAVPQQNPPGELESESESESGQELETASGQNPPEENEIHPYLSITYGRDNPENFTGRDMVFYTYDIVTGELEEECVIPFDSQYACGLVSKADNKVYYSGRSEPNTLGVCDGLWVYDLETGKSSLLETNNWSYNSITMTKSGQLLVMAVTKEHPILPALFDLQTNSFTYMPEVNDEPFDLYTFGPTEAVYNSGTHEIACIFQNEDEIYSDEFRCFEAPANTYIAIASEDMVKDPDRTFAISLMGEDQVLSVTQIYRLYSYCEETGVLTPILLGDLENKGHVISYTIMNP